MCHTTLIPALEKQRQTDLFELKASLGLGLCSEFHEPPIAVCLSLQEYMHHLLALEHRAEEQFLEHWLNPYCKPHCDRNIVHPV